MQEIQVGYSRKVGTDDYGSIGVNASVTFKPDTDDLQKEFDQAFTHLKLVVDAKLAETSEVPSGGIFDKETEATSRGHIPPHPSPTAQAAETVQRPTPVQGPSDTVNDNLAGNDTAQGRDGETFLGHAKVFRTNIKRSTNTNKVFAELRVGHEDLEAHINEKYVTVRVFDPEYVAVVGELKRMKDEETGEVMDVETLHIHKNNFVDVWGKFSPWNSDPTKSDLNASAIQLSAKQ